MQFVGIAAALVAVFFLGSLALSGITHSLSRVSSVFPTNYGYPYSSGTQVAASAKGVPQVAGVSIKNEALTGETIVSTLNTLPNASRFAALFKKANGASFLVEPTLYTLFVPTNEAFAKLPYHLQADVNTMDAEELSRFVTYHLVPQKMVAVGGQKAGVVTAISRDALNFELHDDGGSVGNAHVVAIYHVENGIVYVVDGVLLPPERRVEAQNYYW
ncbi:MAG: fasciclin domain-containing protein [Patescibacteria group bacterium]